MTPEERRALSLAAMKRGELPMTASVICPHCGEDIGPALFVKVPLWLHLDDEEESRGR